MNIDISSYVALNLPKGQPCCIFPVRIIQEGKCHPPQNKDKNVLMFSMTHVSLYYLSFILNFENVSESEPRSALLINSLKLFIYLRTDGARYAFLTNYCGYDLRHVSTWVFFYHIITNYAFNNVISIVWVMPVRAFNRGNCRNLK